MVGLLVVLLIQSAFAPIREIPLAGAEHQPELPSQPIEAWITGDMQQTLDRMTNLSFGFRPMLVRFVNQVRYSLFDEHTSHVIASKEDYLFEASYRASVCGEDYVGQDSIANLIQNFDRFRTQLDERGIALVVLIAPNKWRTMKSKIDWSCKPPKNTNYEAITTALRSKGFAVCDMIDLFCYDQSHRPNYPLHSKQGTHWSIFGAALSLDYLSFAFQQEGIKLPTVNYESIDESTEPRYTDKDLHDLLNLMERPVKETLGYPNISFTTAAPPKVTVVGDSYYWTYYYLGAHQGLFSLDSKFFYYNNSLVADDPGIRVSLTDEVRQRELASSDAVLFVMGEPSLSNLGFGIQNIQLD